MDRLMLASSYEYGLSAIHALLHPLDNALLYNAQISPTYSRPVMRSRELLLGNDSPSTMAVTQIIKA